MGKLQKIKKMYICKKLNLCSLATLNEFRIDQNEYGSVHLTLSYYTLLRMANIGLKRMDRNNSN